MTRSIGSIEEGDSASFISPFNMRLKAMREARCPLTTPELRHNKLARDEFLRRPHRPITVVLHGVNQNYNIGAIFRLCDGLPSCGSS
jgi:tRNA G18 (ribose-2'-O)-methylase SpoU